MKNTFSTIACLFLSLGSIALTSCDDDTDNPVGPVTVPQTVNFEFGMTGYMSAPTTVARFGVAATKEEAEKGRGALYTGKIRYIDTKGGKETVSFALPDQTKGTNRWVYVSTAAKPTGNQTITLNWNINDMLTLNASSADTIVVKELVVR